MERVVTDKCKNCKLTKSEHDNLGERGDYWVCANTQNEFVPFVYLDEREVQAERVRLAGELKKAIDESKKYSKECGFELALNELVSDVLSLVGELEQKEELCPTCGDKPITHSEPCYPNE